MSNNPFGHDGADPQNNPYGGDYDQSVHSSGSYDQGNYGQGDYSQGNYGNQHSQPDFGSSYGQDSQQPVGSQGGHADYQQPVGSQGGYADYQQNPQAYGGSDLYGAGNVGGPGSTEKNSLGVISLVSGIVGFFVWLAGIVAIITGFMSLKAVKNGQANNRGVGLTGLILGFFTTVVGLIVTVIVVIVFVMGIGAASNSPTDVTPGDENEAPADPEGSGEDGSGSDSGPEGEGADNGDFAAGMDKAAKIGTYNDIEIYALITSGKAADTVSPATFRNREVLVIKYFLKNTTDKPLKPGRGSVECFSDGADCSKSVHGEVGGKQMAAPILDFDSETIDPGAVKEFYTAQAIEPKAAENAEITLTMSSADYKDRQSFKIK